MDLSALQTRCETRFRDTSNVIVSADDWTGYLNDAYADVQSALAFWPWMEARSTSLTVAAAARSADLPTDVLAVTSVLNATDDLVMRPYDGTTQTIEDYPQDDETGTPYRYRVFGATLEVFPRPDVQTTLQVEYHAPSADLAVAADVPAFPSQYHRILVEGALARAYVDDGAPDQAQLHQAAFNAILEDLKIAMAAERQERYPGIVDNFWG